MRPNIAVTKKVKIAPEYCDICEYLAKRYTQTYHNTYC